MTKLRALALAAVFAGALGCERSSLMLELGFDGEDNAAKSWLGWYPSKYEPVGTCPDVSPFVAQQVKESQLELAFEHLESKFAHPLSDLEAKELTGEDKPAPGAIESHLSQAEAKTRQAQELVEREEMKADPFLSMPGVAERVQVALEKVKDAKAFAAPKAHAYLVRGVTFNPRELPDIAVCYGEVQLIDRHTYKPVPRLYRTPVVVWMMSPPRRARISVGDSK